MNLPKPATGNLTQAPPLKKLLGPSFILLGLGLGSGELILWPYLSANFGLGIIWGAVIGITLQFFLNMEISRYTLAYGESVFVGLARKLSFVSPIWFLISTLIPWMWPGVVTSSAVILGHLLGIKNIGLLGSILLLGIGALYTLGPVVYKTQESLQKAVIFLGVPFVFLLTLFVATPSDWSALAAGLFGVGEGFNFLPVSIPIATFLAAFAYSGAGGNLNMGQSLYVKEKGYGMASFSSKLTSIVTGKKTSLSLVGKKFNDNTKNRELFRNWWRKVNTEHFIVFWATGLVTMLMLSTLSYATVFGKEGNPTGINFVINQGTYLAANIAPIIGTLFLSVAAVMLFFTQFSVFGTTSRIMSENLAILLSSKASPNKMRYYFFIFLWIQIILGITVLLSGFTEPLGLVVVSAVLNAAAMCVACFLVYHLNTKTLPKSVAPTIARKAILLLSGLFYGGFTIFTIIDRLF